MIEKIYQEEFTQEVINSDAMSVVDFYADWCGPCKMLSPVLEELAKENDDVNFFKVNVDENGELAEKYGVSTIPNVVFIKNGEVINRSIGFKPITELQKLIDSAR